MALRKIEEGEEVTVSYGTHSNFDMLARFGFEVGAKDNLRAHGLSLSGCIVVHFEAIDRFPGGWDLPEEWKCLTETKSEALSTVLAWAEKQRKRLRESLEKARVSVLLGHSDWLSQTLLRIHREQVGIFKGDEARDEYWRKKIDDAQEEEFATRQTEVWNKKAVDAFEAGLKAAAEREAKEAAEWKNKAMKAFGARL